MIKPLSVNFEGYLNFWAKKVNGRLEGVLPRKLSPQVLNLMVGQTRYTLDGEALTQAISQPVWDFLDRGGKRWRPVLFLVILDILGKKPEEYVDFSTIFELIHNGTLIVDDLEDASLTRRGKPALHLLYGQDIAVNAGNALYYLPLKLLDGYQHKLSPETLLKIYKTYIDECINLHFGQGTDIAWHNGLVDDFSISESKYLQMCAFKTGGLARMACKMAAIVGDGSDQMIEAFGRLGESLGVIFQIQDDILNITESELSKKKGLGEDITEGKRSLPVIYAVNSLPPKKAKRLIKILKDHPKDKKLIEEAIGLIKQGGGIEKASRTMVRLFEEAWKKLDPLLEEGEKKRRLYQLAKFLIDRQI